MPPPRFSRMVNETGAASCAAMADTLGTKSLFTNAGAMRVRLLNSSPLSCSYRISSAGRPSTIARTMNSVCAGSASILQYTG